MLFSFSPDYFSLRRYATLRWRADAAFYADSLLEPSAVRFFVSMLVAAAAAFDTLSVAACYAMLPC